MDAAAGTRKRELRPFRSSRDLENNAAFSDRWSKALVMSLAPIRPLPNGLPARKKLITSSSMSG